MRGEDCFSSFRSAIEWPEDRPKEETPTGEWKPIRLALISALDTFAFAWSIAPDCESPIEIDLGAQLKKAIDAMGATGLSLDPQYALGPFRYDFAITRAGHSNPIALIECDGEEFHQTAEQLANDRAKDQLASKSGIALHRFTGAEIFRDARDCAFEIIKRTRMRGCLTQSEWHAFEVVWLA